MQVAGSAATTTPQTGAKSARQRQSEDGAALGGALGLWSAPLGDFLQTLRTAWTKNGGAQRRAAAEPAAARTNTSASATHDKVLSDRAARDNANEAQRDAAQAQDAHTRDARAETIAARNEHSETAHAASGTASDRPASMPGLTSYGAGQTPVAGQSASTGAAPTGTSAPAATAVPGDGARGAAHAAAAQALLAQSHGARPANAALPTIAPSATTTTSAKSTTTARPVEAIGGAGGRAASANIGVGTARTTASTATTKAASAAPAASESDANAEQIVRWVRSRSDQRHSVTTMRLDPPELGKLTLRLELQGDALQLEVETATPAAHRLLSEQTDLLRHSLEAAGIRLERVDVRLQEPVADQPLADPQTQQQSLPNWHQPAGQHESPAQGGSSGGTESPSASTTLAPASLETTTPRMDARGVNVWA